MAYENFLDLAKDRWSVRKYQDKPIEDEKIQKILEAARVAPTAVNYQPQKIYILKSEDALDKIKGLCHFIFDAPIVFMVCYDKNQVWKSPFERGYNSGETDASIVATHMMLEAWDLGIGSVWVRGFDARKVHKAFNLPKNETITCLLPMGYPADDAVPYAPWHDVYKDIDVFTEEL